MAEKLIWELSSPAPFESAWSILVKLSLLNDLSAQQLATFISANKGVKTLDFKSSDWIDFEKFSQVTGIAHNRLRSAFLGELDIEPFSAAYLFDERRAVKHCSSCLAAGYHCVFFDLGFIDTCPWHNRLLEAPCKCCTVAVVQGKYKKVMQKDKENYCRYSFCNHIDYQSNKTTRSCNFTKPQRMRIYSDCLNLLNWLRKVSKNTGLAEKLNLVSLHKYDRESSEKYLSAAESLAGPCPWPLTTQRLKIKTQIWTTTVLNESPNTSINRFNPGYFVSNDSPDWGKVYRSVRRHLQHEFMIEHRSCWNEFSNYSCLEVYRLDSSSTCPITLAFTTWRMACEGIYDIGALKSNKTQNSISYRYGYNSYTQQPSLTSFANYLYAHFFHILEQVLENIRVNEFAIRLTPTFLFKGFAMFVNKYQASQLELTLISEDYESLKHKCQSLCVSGQGTKYMLYPGLTDWQWQNHHQFNRDLKDRINMRVILNFDEKKLRETPTIQIR